MLRRGDLCTMTYGRQPEIVVVSNAVGDSPVLYRVLREKYKSQPTLHEQWLKPLGKNVFDLYRGCAAGIMDEPPEDRLTPAQAAKLLGVSDSTIRERCAKGLLPALQVDGRWVIPKSLLGLPETALAEKLEKEAPAPPA